MPAPNASCEQKAMLLLISIILSKQMQMVALIIPMVTDDADGVANGSTGPKMSIAPHFSHLDLGNTVVPLTTLSIKCCQCLYDWCHMTKRSHVAPHFEYLDLRNTVIPLMTLSIM